MWGLAQMSSLWRDVRTLLVNNVFWTKQISLCQCSTLFLMSGTDMIDDSRVLIFLNTFCKAFTEKYVLEKKCNQKPKALRVTLYCLIKMNPSVVVPRHLECKCKTFANIFLRAYNSWIEILLTSNNKVEIPPQMMVFQVINTIKTGSTTFCLVYSRRKSLLTGN